MKSTMRGFSLIELMIVCVIVAILGAIAIPSYNSQIRKSRRTEAKTAISDLAAREERYFAANNVYATDTAAALQYGSATPVTIGSYYQIYSIVVTAATATVPATFVAQVKPIPGGTQTKDSSCQLFQVDQTGKQTSQDNGGADSTATCWP